jgi:2-polyprenyl-3-methyl-5-hydroxy-6-metoxy-1,4-benzoquinol methylase
VEPKQFIHYESCPLCKGRKLNPFLSSEDYFLTHEVFNIDSCSDCGFKLTNPRPTRRDLPKYYESAAYISHTNTQRGLINKIYHLIRLYALYSKIRLIKKFIQKGSILDIGSGSGEFLKEIQKKQFIGTGIEPNPSARVYAIEHYQLNIIDETEIKNLNQSKFNVITMWHVFEHVYDLDERIKQIQNLLNENGILVVAVPNAKSWDAKHYGKFWAAYDLPRHLYHFEQATLRKLFQKYGFKLVKTEPMIFDSFYISILSEKYKAGKLNFILGVIKGLISNLRAMIAGKNYSSLTYVFKYK